MDRQACSDPVEAGRRRALDLLPMSLDLRKKVAIVGVGCTRFGELYETSAEDLICDAVDEPA